MADYWTIERVVYAPQKAVDRLNAAAAREQDLLEANNRYQQEARDARASEMALAEELRILRAAIRTRS